MGQAWPGPPGAGPGSAEPAGSSVGRPVASGRAGTASIRGFVALVGSARQQVLLGPMSASLRRSGQRSSSPRLAAFGAAASGCASLVRLRRSDGPSVRDLRVGDGSAGGRGLGRRPALGGASSGDASSSAVSGVPARPRVHRPRLGDARGRRPSGIALGDRLEQQDRARDRRVERPDRAAHRDAHEQVDRVAGLRPEALALAADDERQRPAQVGLADGQRRVARRRRRCAGRAHAGR